MANCPYGPFVARLPAGALNTEEERKGRRRYTAVRYARQAKVDCLTHYSRTDRPQCECCGEEYLEFLTIDHINGGGTKHRKEVCKGGGPMYRHLRKTGYPRGLRVLCMNCNHALGHFGYCPHDRRG